MIYKQLLLVPLVFVFIILSCDRNPVSSPTGDPTTYYLRYQDKLSQEPGPSSSWLYITYYIYPSGSNTSASWRTNLDWNITNSKYGCDLIFWSQSDAHVRIDYIIDDDGTETILASKDCDIRYISETTGIQIKCDITEDNAILGNNPKSGKNGDLIFRITHISGTDPVEILFDGGPGTIGNTSISVSHDR